MKNEKHYFHAASKGLEDQLLFSSREQFIAGMNRIGICLLDFPEVVIIAFVLMNNHVHFILHGTYEDCMAFMAKYRKLSCYYSSNKDNEKIMSFEFDCWIIPNKEKLQEKICYVLRNPLAAGISVLPTQYLWGSGPLMFANHQASVPERGPYGYFHPLGQTTEYLRRKMFNTKHDIPQNWMVNEEGMIWPGSYVEYKRAEQSFDSITNFMFELNKKNEDIINQEMYGSTISLNDNDVLSILKSKADNLFGEKDLSLLSVEKRLELIRAVRRSHGCDIKQLARLLHIKLRDLKLIW